MANVEENIDYDFDESVEDYSDDYDYEGDEMEQDITAHKDKKLKADYKNPVGDLLDSSLDASGNKSTIEEPVKDERNDMGVYASLLESKYNSVKSKYKEARQEINELKRKRNVEQPNVGNSDERVKQLEDRVVLIKTKAKERIAEKDAVIAEQNEKLKKFEEILALLEVNCKQAVVKYNDAQTELAKKEETLQLHLSFKNRYDYKVNFLDEKCRKQKNEYEVKIRKLEEKLGIENKEPQVQVKPEVKDQKLKISKVSDTKVKPVVTKKPKSLRIEKVEPEPKLPKVVKGLTIKEVLVSPVEEESSGGVEKPEVAEEEPAKEEVEPITASKEEAANPIVTSLPGVKITLTEAIDELDQLEFEEPKLE